MTEHELRGRLEALEQVLGEILGLAMANRPDELALTLQDRSRAADEAEEAPATPENLQRLAIAQTFARIWSIAWSKGVAVQGTEGTAQ